MSLQHLLSQSAVVTHRGTGTADAEGNPTVGTDADSTYPAKLIQGGGVGLATGERPIGRTRGFAEWTVFLPPEAIISSGDKVTVDGRAYEVDGIPYVVNSPRGAHHIEAPLKFVEA